MKISFAASASCGLWRKIQEHEIIAKIDYLIDAIDLKTAPSVYPLHAKIALMELKNPMADYFSILENSAVRFGYRISVLANWYRGPGYKDIEQKFGLTEPECSALFCIGHSDGLTATDVCNITGRPKNSMSRAISVLMDKNLLSRATDEVDARKKRLVLTPEGRTLYEKIVPIFLRSEQRIVQPLTPSELSDLDRLLTKMTQHITSDPHAY